jgi:hypothetical protein
VDGAGNLYVADTGAHRVRAVLPDGTLVAVAGPAACPAIEDTLICPRGEAGDGGPGPEALLRAPPPGGWPPTPPGAS